MVIGDTAPKDPNNMEEEKEEVKYHFEKDAEDYSVNNCSICRVELIQWLV